MNSSCRSVATLISQQHFLVKFKLKVSLCFLQQQSELSALQVFTANIFKERKDDMKDIKTIATKGFEKYVKQHFIIQINIKLVQR